MNADDFGRTPAVNRAVIRAHQDGVLTSASLMVGASAADEAVELAQSTPALAVGLHLVFSQDVPLLPAGEIDCLTDGSGRFRADPLRVGIALLSGSCQRQLRRELRAQFERFNATGLTLSHVDGHMHLHVHPAVFPIVLDLADEFRAAAVRIPREPWWASFETPCAVRIKSLVRVACLRLVSAPAAARARERGFIISDYVLGISSTGAMTRAYVVKMLQHVSAPLIELIFHPTDGPRIDELGPNPGDLQTLLDTRLQQTIGQMNLTLANYTLLKQQLES